MSTMVFELKKENLFNQLKSDGKLFTFESFLIGVDKILVGKITVVFSDKEIDAKVVKIMPEHPSFKDFGRRVELVVC